MDMESSMNRCHRASSRLFAGCWQGALVRAESAAAMLLSEDDVEQVKSLELVETGEGLPTLGTRASTCWLRD